MENLYKNYIPTNGKRAIVPFKGKSAEELFTFEQVCNMPSYAGVLEDDTVLIDLDDEVEGEKLLQIIRFEGLNCKVYQTTRGYHFLFKFADGQYTSNKTHCKLAIGLTADIKLGSKSSYEALKIDGVPRKIVYNKSPYQIAPRWLTPVRTNQELAGLENGGRNSALYGYILTLQKHDFSVEECKECLRIINSYIFKEPLPDEELAVITRESAFEKPMFFNSKGSFLFDKFATYIRNQYNIVRINGSLHIYKDGYYQHNLTDIEYAMIENIPNLTRDKRKEVMSYLDVIVRNSYGRADSNLICFKNGVYNIVEEELTEHSPEYLITNQIQANYNPNAYSELMDKTLDKLACGNEKIRMLIEEMIGYCFYTKSELGKAFLLTGEKSNGKSTLLHIIKTLLGDDNVSALDLKELGAEFKTAELAGMLANIGDDISANFIEDTGLFKKIVTGDRLTAARKYEHPFTFEPYCKLLFSANDIPRMKDRSGAVIRRLIIIPFNATFSKNDPDYSPYIKYELCKPEALEYLAQLGLKGLKRVLYNQGFTECKEVTQELEQYEKDNNPILGFLEEREDCQIINQPTGTVFRDYQGYCVANGMQPMSNALFSKFIKQKKNCEIAVRKVDGKSCRIFLKKS